MTEGHMMSVPTPPANHTDFPQSTRGHYKLLGHWPISLTAFAKRLVNHGINISLTRFLLTDLESSQLIKPIT